MKKTGLILICLTLLILSSACQHSKAEESAVNTTSLSLENTESTPSTTVPSLDLPDNNTPEDATTPPNTDADSDAVTETHPNTSQTASTPSGQPNSPQTPAPSGAEIVAQGKCNGVAGNWKLTKDGTFTIYGNARPENSNTYPWKNYGAQVKKVVVEEGIKHVPSSAFFGFKNLTEVVLANSVESIGKDAFSNCTALTTITIPPKVTVLETGTFTGCTKLEYISFAPNSQLHTLNEGVFGASGLKEFIAPPKLKVLKSRAFVSLPALETVILNESVEIIEPQAFIRCAALKKVVLGATIISLGNYAFNECTTITHYESYANRNINFASLPHLKTVIIGGDVTTIPNFTHCTSLTSVSITSPIEEIDNGQFMGCTSLTNFSIPTTVSLIDNHAFVASGIQTITIPASVKKMGVCVFNKSALQEITFVGDPPIFYSNATDGTFSGVDALVAYYPANNPAWTEDVLQNYGAGEITWIAK